MTRPRRRATRQKHAIAVALNDADAFLSAQELHDRLQAQGSPVALATVYRNLQSMEAEGRVDVLRRTDGELTFRRCHSEGHHHHVVCRDCGYSVEVAAPAVETWAEEVGRHNGFTELSHDLEVFGLCESCR